MSKRLAVAAIAVLFLAFPVGTVTVAADIIWPCGNCHPNAPAVHWAGEIPACGNCPRAAEIIVVNPGKPSCSLCSPTL